MRRSLAAMLLAATAFLPNRAFADVTYPAVPGNIDPSTVVWFYGCTD